MMASKLTENSIAGDVLLSDELLTKAYPNANTMDPVKLIQRMVKDGVIQVDALLERAISAHGKLKRESTTGRDFIDGSDAKKSTVGWVSKQYKSKKGINVYRSRNARISNLTHKKGWLRVAVADKLTNQNYFFYIPFKAYKGLKEIDILFTEDSGPSPAGRFYQYWVKSFKDICVS